YPILWPPRLIVTAVHPPAQTLVLKSEGINSLDRLDVFSETSNEYVWSVRNRKDGLPQQITFGIVPPAFQQDLPKVGGPRSLRTGETLILRFRCQYDLPMKPSMGALIWTAKVEDEESIRILHPEAQTLGRRPSIDLPPVTGQKEP